jgi:hypothetical protein
MEKRPWVRHHRSRRGRILLAAAFTVCCHSQEREAVSPATAGSGELQVSPADSQPAPTLEDWLDALAVAESGNRQWLVHRDRDGRLYYGCLQFRERTFRAYARKFHLLPSRSETMNAIYDCSFQKRLAALMLRDDPRNWRHWKGTVVNRVGLPPADTAP